MKLASKATYPPLQNKIIELRIFCMKGSQVIIKNNLKSLRKQHGLKQKEIAILLGMKSEDRISHWEKGIAVPGLTNLFKLSLVYNVSPYDLYPEIAEEIKSFLITRV